MKILIKLMLLCMPVLASSQSIKTGDVFVDSLRNLEYCLLSVSSTFDAKFGDSCRYLMN
ncbi:MAG: hypothetical protein ACOYXB_05125 [Bacteroidota bacterium]